MMTDATILALSAVLTFLMLGMGSFYRNQAWLKGAICRAVGNRDDLPPPTPISGRADRAAANMIEGMVLLVALLAAVHFAGKTSAQSTLGANIFFWARVAYWPCYLAGIAYLRTMIWTVGIAGLGMIAAAAIL